MKKVPCFRRQDIFFLWPYDLLFLATLLFSVKIPGLKYSSVFRENRCPPPPKPVYGGNFSHEAVTLKIRSRSSNLISC